MTAVSATDAVARVVAFYEHLTPSAVARIGELYAAEASFRDPFNNVRGVDPIRDIFTRMFAHLDDCRFRIVDTVVDGNGALLVWDFEFRLRNVRPGLLRTIHGASHLRFDAEGRVIYHRDYWDAAEELYAKLPIVGALMRWLRRRLG